MVSLPRARYGWKGWVTVAVLVVIPYLVKFVGYSTLPEAAAQLPDKAHRAAAWLSANGAWFFPLLSLIILIGGLLWLYAPHISARLVTKDKSSSVGTSPPVLSTRPLQSDAIAPLLSNRSALLARLGITNNGSTLLRRCSVRLIDAMRITFGFVQSAPTAYPSILQWRGESFLLSWSLSEKNRKGDYHQYLDLASDRSEHYVNILFTDHPDEPDADISIARFAAADRFDLQGKLQGIGGERWWKIVLRIASESDTPNVTDVELLASYWPDNGPPSYILLYDWLPRGEAILQHQSAERKAKKRAKPNSSD